MTLFRVVACSLAAAWLLPAQASLAPRVLVIYNTNPAHLAASEAVARHYQTERAIPAQNVCGINFSHNEDVTETEWLTTYRNAVRTCLDAATGSGSAPGRGNVLYVVMSHQTPFRITRGARLAALDSYIADVWDQVSASYFPQIPPGNHRYFDDAQSYGNVFAPFQTLAQHRSQPRAAMIYSVWRLDGEDVTKSKALVDRAKSAELAGGVTGTVYLDRQVSKAFLESSASDYSNLSGNHDLLRAGYQYKAAGLTVVEDEVLGEIGGPPLDPGEPLPIATAPNAAIFGGWYGYNVYRDVYTWNAGAVGVHLDSASALHPRAGGNWVANALKRGITVTSGAVDEPYLEGMAHFDVVSLHLLRGGNVGDAFLRAEPWVKWMILNLGDPLYRPFPGGRAGFGTGAPEASLTLLPRFVVGGQTVTGTVTLKDPAPLSGQVVGITYNNPPFVPGASSTVTIPSGQRSATFVVPTIVAAPDMYSIRVEASAGSTVLLNSLHAYPMLNSLQASARTIKKGTALSVLVAINERAPASGLTVNLTSSHPSVIALPATTVIPFGSRAKILTVTAGEVTSNQDVTLTASYAGHVETVVVTVTP